MAHEQQRPKPSTAKDDKKPPLAVEDEAALAPEHQPPGADQAVKMPRTGYVPPNLLALQRTVGNQAVQRMLNPAQRQASGGAIQSGAARPTPAPGMGGGRGRGPRLF